jgi:DNA polymerase elongation subunit (family B)
MDTQIWVVMESGYHVKDNKPYVNLYSRNYNNPMETITNTFPYTPYFYCPASEAHKHHHLITSVDPNVVLDAKGREICRVNVRVPGDVPKVRDIYSWTDESDVVFDKRFLVDHKIKYAYEIVDDKPIPVDVEHPMDPRIVYFDIEVRSPEGIFPHAYDSEYPIVSIQTMDNYTEKIAVFTFEIDNINDPDQIYCESEKELLKIFSMYISELNPDIMAAWNSDQFDLPYLIKRASNIGTNLSGLSRYGECSTKYDSTTGKFRSYVPGRAFLDQMEAFEKYNIGKGQRESNGLKSVIADKDLLKDAAFTYQDLGPILDRVINEKRFVEYIQYCKNDVIALRTIDKKLGLYNFFETTRVLVGSKIMDGLHNSLILEIYVMHEGIKPMPRKKYGGEKEKFEGALVVKPQSGIHEWVANVDLNALYPNIIVGYNVSPDIDNIIAKSTKKLMDLRDVYREQKKQGLLGASARDSSAKSLVNSVYGIMGAKSSRLYDKEKALFITSTGQKLNRHIQKLCESRSKTITYGDTDSVFISEVHTGSECLELEKWLNEELAKWSDENGSSIHFTLKAEKLFRRLLFKPKSNNRNVPGKKKYAGHLIWEEGRDCNEFKFMGLEIKRSDNSNITKDCLKYFLTTSIIDGDLDKALSYVRNKYNDVLNGTADIYSISMPKEIRAISYDNKNSWVNGRDYAKENYNYIIQEGEKPRLIYLLHNQVICIDDGFDTEQIRNEIDWHTMADKTIKSKLQSYFWAVNIEWDGAIKGQTNLDKWF